MAEHDMSQRAEGAADGDGYPRYYDLDLLLKVSDRLCGLATVPGLDLQAVVDSVAPSIGSVPTSVTDTDR